MQTTNTLPIVNFAREYGWNPVEASLLGASSVISGDTPVDNILHTLQTFAQSHGGQWPPASIGQSCKDQNGNTVPCPSEGDYQKPSAGTAGAPDNSGDWHQEDVWIDAQGNKVPPNTPGATRNPMWVRGAGIVDSLTSNADNWFKRAALVVAAIVLIAIAIISLR